MRISYRKLRRQMLINRMRRKDLMREADISSYNATKLNNDELVSMEVLMRVCMVFKCDIGDICEFVYDEEGIA